MIRSQRFVYSSSFYMHGTLIPQGERKRILDNFPLSSLPLREAWLQSVQMCSALLLV